MREIVLVLPNIRSSENVGALFRSADAFGVQHIYCIGYTPLPIDRFGRPNTKLIKAALGGEQSVPWSYQSTCDGTLTKLKDEGFDLIALEQDDRSENIFEVRYLSNKIALILGNEVSGISDDVLEKVDHILEIPMMGQKESLNVSVSGGIALAVLRYLTK